jgi:hypothetical protein
MASERPVNRATVTDAEERDPEVLYGIPGICYDIDGNWWHEPGSQGDCCGIVSNAEVIHRAD